MYLTTENHLAVLFTVFATPVILLLSLYVFTYLFDQIS